MALVAPFLATLPPGPRSARFEVIFTPPKNSDVFPPRLLPSNVKSHFQAQRKIKSEAYYVEKKGAKQLKEKAAAEADLTAVAPVLEQFGF